MVGVAALTQATQGTEALSPLATEISEVQNRVVRSRAVVYASVRPPLLGEQAAAAECQRYARSNKRCTYSLCKALSSTRYRGTITPRVRLAHQQVLQHRFTQEQRRRRDIR